MAVKTITLTGAEVAVLGLDGANAHIRNDGTEVIYAAKTAGITTGADGVLSIPAGQAATVYGISGTVYMLGTGSAQIISNDYSELPFKTSTASGGSAVDEQARTALGAHVGNAEIHVTAEEKAAWNGKAEISDIPTTLPANGGNADTLDGLHANEIASNPNLLINSWFGSGVVNQRGQTTYPAVSGTSNTIDCWRTVDELGLTVNDGFITLSNGDSLWHKYFNQSVEGLKRFAGQEVTISAKVRCSTGDYYLAGGKHIDTGSEWQIVSHTFTVYESDDLTTIYGGYGVSGSIDVMWTKLELGSIATPFFPPNPALELEKCQRYYQIRSIGDIPAVDLRPSMRTTPTVTQLADGNYAYSTEL